MHHPSSSSMSIGTLSSGINWPEREENHSPSSSAEVKDGWRINFTSLYKVIMRAGITLQLRLEHYVVIELGKL